MNTTTENTIIPKHLIEGANNNSNMLTREDKLTIRSILKNEIDFMVEYIRRYEMSDDIKRGEIKRLRRLNHIRIHVLNA